MSRRYWYFYTFLMAIALYWLSNLILWYPWSIHPLWGMVLMLTLNPVIWGIGEYACLQRFPGQGAWCGAWMVALVMVGVSSVSDYLFFDLFLHSGDVWHPTTFYGYIFVGGFPFLITALFRKHVQLKRREVKMKELKGLAGIVLSVLFLFFAFVI